MRNALKEVCLVGIVLHLVGAADAAGLTGHYLSHCSLHSCLHGLPHIAGLAGIALLQPGETEHRVEGGSQLVVKVFKEVGQTSP